MACDYLTLAHGPWRWPPQHPCGLHAACTVQMAEGGEEHAGSGDLCAAGRAHMVEGDPEGPPSQHGVCLVWGLGATGQHLLQSMVTPNSPDVGKQQDFLFKKKKKAEHSFLSILYLFTGDNEIISLIQISHTLVFPLTLLTAKNWLLIYSRVIKSRIRTSMTSGTQRIKKELSWSKNNLFS